MIKSFVNLVSRYKLSRMKYKSGVYGAARLDVDTGYNKAWIRDNVYMALGLEQISTDEARKVLQGLLDLMLKHEYKIDWAIKEKPDDKYKYIHARFCPLTFEEFPEDWGNKQNDAIGGFLFKIGQLFKKGVMVIRNDNDLRVIQKLVQYLESIQYWHDPDNGVWENDEELHASSIGACLAGLKAVSGIVDVPVWIIAKGRKALDELLPAESHSKNVDLALLSLIYPYNVVTNEQKSEILHNVESLLVRDNGVVRYFGDWYYNNGQEAEWVMGFPWLAIIYKQLGDTEKYTQYMTKTFKCMNWKGDLPELYYGGSKKYNENTPLGWNHAMLLCALNA